MVLAARGRHLRARRESSVVLVAGVVVRGVKRGGKRRDREPEDLGGSPLPSPLLLTSLKRESKWRPCRRRGRPEGRPAVERELLPVTGLTQQVSQAAWLFQGLDIQSSYPLTPLFHLGRGQLLMWDESMWMLARRANKHAHLLAWRRRRSSRAVRALSSHKQMSRGDKGKRRTGRKCLLLPAKSGQQGGRPKPNDLQKVQR